MSLADAIRAASQRIGANPLDMATVMSFESGFRPAVRGGAGNRHVGLIQFGIPEQQKYGVSQSTPAEQQVDAASRFLVDRGFKPGMGLADMYSAVNAGHVGLGNRSDAMNGGTWGSVDDKVNFQMEGHKAKAAALLGGTYTPPSPAAGGGALAPAGGQTPQAGTSLADALGAGVTLPTLAPVIVPTGPDPLDELSKQQATAQAAQQVAKQQADQQRKTALAGISAFYR